MLYFYGPLSQNITQTLLVPLPLFRWSDIPIYPIYQELSSLLSLSPAHGTRVARVFLDVLAGVVSGPELTHEGTVITVVEVSEEWPDGLGRFLSMIEGDFAGVAVSTNRVVRAVGFWYLREEMMHDVSIDNAVEDVPANEAEITIDCGQGSSNERPALAVVVREVLVRVVEVGDSD